MGTMLYNGVELPDIETVWTNKATHPCAFIRRGSDGEQIYLFLCKEFGTTGSGQTDSIMWGGGSYYQYPLDGDSWGNYYYGSNGYNSYFTCPIDDLFWVSEDVYNSDGVLIFAASDPVDPNAPTVDTARRLKSLINGLLCGLVSPGQLKAREATMYSYNGVVLPKLPEWDRESYPYASILYDGTQFWVHAQTQAEKIVRYDDLFGYVYMVESYTTGKQWYLDNSGTWKLYDVIYSIKANVELYSYKKTPEDYAVWTDYDVIWADTGEIFFAASDPVPVYE